MIKRRGPYKQYLRDPSIPIPRTTLRRRLREHARLFQSPEQDRHGISIKEEYKLECNPVLLSQLECDPVLLSQLECDPVQDQHGAKVELKREQEVVVEDGWACGSMTAQHNVMDKQSRRQSAPAASTIGAAPQVSTLSLKKNRFSDTWARKNGRQNSRYRAKYTSSHRDQDIEPEPPEGHSWMVNGDHQYSEPQERLYEAFTPTSRYSRPRTSTSTTLHSTPHHQSQSQIALSEREAYFQAEAAKWRTKYETHKGDFSQLHDIVERLTFLVERLENSMDSCQHRSSHTEPCSHTSRELPTASWSMQDDQHSDDEFEEKVHIGNNIFLAKHQYEKLRQFDANQFTANLLALLFSREEMATHMLLDDKSHAPRRDARPKLNKDIVQAIVCHVVDKFKLDPKTVMEFVRTKLETEERMYKLSAIQSCFS
uniref:uncharacterized protein n=1 Tax=Myxine glutinosa TaxID=7769 RepID=UPI003590297B